MDESRISYWPIIKPILLILLPIVLLLSILPGPSGRPIMPLHDWLPDARLVTDALNQTRVGKQITGKETTIYKWQDEKGHWHFSETVPEHLRAQSETLTLSTEVNTIRPPEDLSRQPQSETPGFMQNVGLSDLPKVLESALDAREMMNERAKASEDL